MCFWKRGRREYNCYIVITLYNYVVTNMRKYVTISVLREVKEILEKDKKGKDWSEYLLELYRLANIYRRKKAFEELRRLLTPEELEAIKRSSEEFRERFRLR